MKDFALVILSVTLAWLLGGAWGHRRRLHRVKEQLDVLALLPKHWDAQRAELESVADRDLGRYLESRNPRAPLHRQMSRTLDVAYVGGLLMLLSQLTFVPGPDWAKETAMTVGLTIAVIATGFNLWVLLRSGDQINAELEAAAERTVALKRDTRRRRAGLTSPPSEPETPSNG